MWTLSRWKLCEPKMARKKTLRGYNGCLKMQSLAITKKGSSWAVSSLAFVLFVSTEKKWGLKFIQNGKKPAIWTLKNPKEDTRFCIFFYFWKLLRWRFRKVVNDFYDYLWKNRFTAQLRIWILAPEKSVLYSIFGAKIQNWAESKFVGFDFLIRKMSFRTVWF